ncbi:MAG: PilZ domain-containing protein [Candidatus Acidiferrum sp.]
MERRQHERYGLQAPVSFSWKDSRNTSQRREGLLLNISGGGVFIATRDLPPRGARIRLRVSLQTVVAGAELDIRASAEVVRAELPGEGEAAERTGFAAAIKAFTLRR